MAVVIAPLVLLIVGLALFLVFAVIWWLVDFIRLSFF
jgi:hypothetical protein